MRVRKTKNDQPRRRGGFTLLEVLLVLIILGVIAALVVPQLMGTQERANINATRASVHGLEETLKLYSVEHSARPPQTLDDLLHPKDLKGQAMKPYLDEFPKDAWGQALNYDPGSAAGSNTPRIWSNGPNGQNEDGGGDDINNWSERQSGT